MVVSSLKSLTRWLKSRCAAGLIALVKFYQRGISPLLGPSCRFQPTCSEYMIGAIGKYGPIRGTLKGIWRILRCHPFNRGGADPP
ncbi:membrane protein insertion efficiency factor YidD [Aureliella helgolandensis]|uniref:Putative membrane protein insertion efficiency factor n=1 Tax=Aureliella helgolandensis TaxID=2527968 RepID=A0A518GF91_9BACT|nr:membrane protein insertion efficiency factor YidD [Aureliella helgolandensis]QDV27266.1 Putative membrane protein insertion efficiency factor [Aureliella helgolandensis]